MIVCEPFIDYSIANQHPKLRPAVILVEILHIHLVLARSAIEAERCGTFLCRWPALHRFPARSSFTWNNVERCVALQLHRFSLNAIGIVTHPAEPVGYAGNLKKPIANSVAPDNRMPRLIFEAPQHCPVSLFIQSAFQCFP